MVLKVLEVGFVWVVAIICTTILIECAGGDLAAEMVGLEEELSSIEGLYRDLLDKAKNLANEAPKKDTTSPPNPKPAPLPLDCPKPTDGDVTNAQVFARDMTVADRACDALLGFALVDNLRASKRDVCKDGGASTMLCYESAGMGMCQGRNVVLVGGGVQASCAGVPDGKAATSRVEGPVASLSFDSAAAPSNKETLTEPTLVLHPGLLKAQSERPCEVIGGLLNAFVLLEVTGTPVDSVGAVYVSDGNTMAEDMATFLWNKIFAGAQPMKILSRDGPTLLLENGLFPAPASQSFLCTHREDAGECSVSNILQSFARIARKRVGVLSHNLPPETPVKGKTVVAVVADSTQAQAGSNELAEKVFSAVKQRANPDTTEVLRVNWHDTENQIGDLRRVHVLVAIDGVPALLSPFLADESSVLVVRCREHYQDYRTLVKWMEKTFLHHGDEANEKALMDKVNTLVRLSRNYYNFLGNGCGLDCPRV